MDIFPKFIIETDDELGDCLIIAKCTYHKDIVTDKSKVKGGGWWTLKDTIFTFSGESCDFGPAKLEDIEKCVQSGNVFTNPILIEPITNKFSFAYDSGSEIKLIKKL